MVAPRINEDDWPTVGRLVRALKARSAPQWMIHKAKLGQYHSYLSSYDTPTAELLRDCRLAGKLKKFARQVEQGNFDATPAESELWASQQTDPEMLAALEMLKKNPPPGELKNMTDEQIEALAKKAIGVNDDA